MKIPPTIKRSTFPHWTCSKQATKCKSSANQSLIAARTCFCHTFTGYQDFRKLSNPSRSELNHYSSFFSELAQLNWTSKAIVGISSIQISNTLSSTSVWQVANHCEKHASTFKMVLAKSGYMPISVCRRYGFIYSGIQKSETTRNKCFYFTRFGLNVIYIYK